MKIKENNFRDPDILIQDVRGGKSVALFTEEGDAAAGDFSAAITTLGNVVVGNESIARSYNGDVAAGDESAAYTGFGESQVGENSVAWGTSVSIGKNSVGIVTSPEGVILKVIINSADAELIQVDTERYSE